MTEDQLHMQVVNWLKMALPEDAVFHHSANQSSGNKFWRMKRGRLGMVSGWPDLEIIYRGKPIFIELKAPKKYPTKTQRAVHKRLTLAGGVVTVCRSLEAVESFLEQLMPLKARVQA